MSQEQFITLLNLMKGDNNEARRKAELTFFKTRDKQPNETLLALLQIARTHTNAELRAFCFLLLKKLFHDSEKKKPLFLSLSSDLQNIYKVELLTGADKEINDKIRDYICDVISDIAIVIFVKGNTWPELVMWILNNGALDSKEAKSNSFRVMKEIGGYLVDIPDIHQNFSNLIQILASGLTFNDSKVKLEALQATITFVQFGKNYRQHLQNLIEPMFGIIPYCLDTKDDKGAQDAIKSFVDLAELDPGFFFPKIDSITESMITLASNKNLSLDVNRLAAEFLISLAENKRDTCKKNSHFVSSCIQILLQMMLNVPEVTQVEWDKIIENEDIETFIVAEEYLDRLSMALGGDVVVPLIWNYILQFMENESWKYRHAGLKALGMMAEGCVDVLLSGMNDIVNLLVKGADDVDPRVRYAVTSAIGHVSTDFGPKFQNKYHEVIIPKMLQLLSNNSYPKIQSQIASALVNFCEKFDSPLIEPYLNDLITALCRIINEGSQKNKEQSMLALSIVVQCAKKRIIPFYDSLMPSLVEIFKNATDKTQRTLRGKAMLTISSIAMASGKEKFMKDSNFILGLLKNAQEAISDPDDPQDEFFSESWSNIAETLGVDFAPYLEVIIPQLLESASREVEYPIDEEDDIDEEIGEIHTLENDTKIIVDIAEANEKLKALSLLTNYAISTKEAFFPYVEKMSNIFVPLVDYLYKEELKVAAIVGIPPLISCAQLYAEKNNLDNTVVSQVFNYLFPKLFEVTKKEHDPETFLVELESIHQCIHSAGKNCLSNEQIGSVFGAIKTWVLEFRENRKDLLISNPEKDQDDTSFIREELHVEESITTSLAEVMTAVIKNHKETFIPKFTETGMLEFVLSLLTTPASNTEFHLAICIFDDMVEYTQELSHPLFPQFIPTLISNIKNPNASIRQAITFGTGVFAQYGGTVIQPYLEQITTNLIDVISAPDSHNKTYASSTENAISSIGKIIRYQPQALGNKLSEVTDLWLTWLPLEIDIVEAKLVNQLLCDFITENNIYILGENYKNLGKILSIFADAIESRVSKKATSKAMVNIVKNMQEKIPQITNEAFNSLPKSKQERLIRLVNSQM